MESRLVAVVGGQFGSEGKGAVCAALARGAGTLVAVRTGGPNAGHTVYDDDGHRWTFRQVPVSAVVRRDAMLVIAAGSEVNLGVLAGELEQLDLAGYAATERLLVDGQATVLTEAHCDMEGHYGGHLTQQLGSTGKGVGAARSERIWRRADLYGGEHDTTAWLLEQYHAGGRTIMIEGSQGYGLGLHAGWYPFCTSRDCRAIDDLALVGILPTAPVEVWVVLRTYPIRVAGNSGPLPFETNWGLLEDKSGGYITPELTSVTRQTRRVGLWDGQSARAAVRANAGCRVALMMFDYWFPGLAGATHPDDLTDEHLARLEVVELDIGAKVGMIGTGPSSHIRLPDHAATEQEAVNAE